MFRINMLDGLFKIGAVGIQWLPRYDGLGVIGDMQCIAPNTDA